ncbi:MAG: NAD(P)-dependent oxidoreductase [Roseburia sp.]|nr:NAD(P)-dependent oxidoreductase [Roseburia sp.]
MDILLVGGDGNLMKAMIDKLHKEGHRIYVLTGSKYREAKDRKVFEYYRFTYDSDSLNDVFDSVNPDVILSLGAYDSVFNWSDPRRESIHYSNSILNMLMAYALHKKGRFVYLSSEEVYCNSYPNDIEEDEPTCPKGFRSMILAQAEQLCFNYSEQMGLDVVVARLDHFCGIPRKKWEAETPCGRLCMEGFRTGDIAANANISFAPLFVSDAVEYIYRLMTCESHQRMLYNLSSGNVVTELQLAKLVSSRLGYLLTITDNTVGSSYRVVLSSEAFREEFGQRVVYTPEKIVERIVGYMRNHRRVYLNPSDEDVNFLVRFVRHFRITFEKLVPFLENMICFVPFFMLNNRATDSRYFQNLDFYLLYVLLFAIVYGQHQATFSALLAMAGYIFRQMYSRSGFDVLLDYNTYVWIAQLFILGLVVGYMRDQLRVIKAENEQEIEYLEDQVGDIQDINSTNVRMKDVLISQLANQNDSIGKIYDITSSLGRYAPDEVLFYAADVLSRLLHSRDIAIYSVKDDTYARLCSATSDTARQMGNSLKYQELEGLTEVLYEKRVYINKGLQKGYPLMANAIYEEESLRLIIMVWGLSWDRMTMSQANMLSVISLLVRDALVRADRYMDALREERYVDDTSILEEEAFVSLTRAHLEAKEKGLTECSLICLNAAPTRENSVRLSKMLRQSDYLGEMEDKLLYVLLSNTNATDAVIVLKRFREQGFEGEIREALEA